MILEIDDDFSDEIVATNLAQSYIGILEMIKEGNNHEDDVASWKELLPAIMLVGGWYSVDFPSEIKKAKKAGKKK